MGARRLSLLLGAYVFGVLDTDARWADLYQRWLDAGEAMEGTLKAYLRAQGVEGLPRRLREVVGSWPKDGPSEARKVKVLKVEMVTRGDWRETGVNSQATGLEGADSRAKRRPPLVILAGALEADHHELAIDDDASAAWSALVRFGKGRPLDVLSDETTRVLGLVGLADLPERAMSPQSTTSSTFTPRRRSFSHDPTPLSPLSEDGSPSTSPYGASRRFPNKSVGNLLPPRPSSSWSEFAATGFGDDQSELGLLPPKLLKAATVGPSAARLNKGLPRSPSEGSVPSLRPAERQRPTSTLTAISIVELDDEFQDYYLDTLVDASCDRWPSFVLSDLGPRTIAELRSLGLAVDHVLVSESLVAFENALDEQPVLSRALSSRSTASLADSTMSQRWNRRMSSLFTGSLASRARYANGGSFISNDPISPVLPASPSPRAPSSPRKKKSSPPPPPLPSSPPASGSPPPEGPKKARRFSLSKRTSRTSLPGENGVPALPTMPLNFLETSPLSSPVEAVAPASPPAPTLPAKDLAPAVEVPSRPPTPAKSSLRPQSVRQSFDTVQPAHASSDLVDLPPVSVDESQMHQGHAPTVSEMFPPPAQEEDEMEYHAVDIESPMVEQEPRVEQEMTNVVEVVEKAPEPGVEAVVDEPIVEKAPEPVPEPLIEAPVVEPVVEPESLVAAPAAIEAPIVDEPAPTPVVERTPTFELSPPEPEAVSEPEAELVPAPVRKDSVETLRRSPEEVDALGGFSCFQSAES